MSCSFRNSKKNKYVAGCSLSPDRRVCPWALLVVPQLVRARHGRDQLLPLSFSMYGILLQKQSWWTSCPRVSPAPELPPLVWKHLSSLCSRSLGADGNRRLIGGGDTHSPITGCPFPGTRNAFPSSGSGDAQSYPCVHPGAPPDMQSPSSLAR